MPDKTKPCCECPLPQHTNNGCATPGCKCKNTAGLAAMSRGIKTPRHPVTKELDPDYKE